MTSINAELFHREQEPEFYARLCRYCKQPESKCDCADELRDRQRDEER